MKNAQCRLRSAFSVDGIGRGHVQRPDILTQIAQVMAGGLVGGRGSDTRGEAGDQLEPFDDIPVDVIVVQRPDCIQHFAGVAAQAGHGVREGFIGILGVCHDAISPEPFGVDFRRPSIAMASCAFAAL